MRLVSFYTPRGITFGMLDGDTVVDLCGNPHASGTLKDFAPRNALELVSLGPAGLDAAREAAEASIRAGDAVTNAAGTKFAAPIPRPGKLLALAGNYGEHLRESGHEWAEKELTTPRLFMKPGTAITGPYEPIIYPPNGNKIDYEGEFAVVIGKEARFVKAADAMDCVLGYTVMNDVSERKLKVETGRQDRDGDKWFDWLNGKWFDTFAPMGPSIAFADEIGDPHALSLRTLVNGEVRQDASTGQMIFGVDELIEWASRWITLEPGDIIATGTPAGVGSASETYLSPGDVVEIAIEKVGTIRNEIVNG